MRWHSSLLRLDEKNLNSDLHQRLERSYILATAIKSTNRHGTQEKLLIISNSNFKCKCTVVLPTFPHLGTEDRGKINIFLI